MPKRSLPVIAIILVLCIGGLIFYMQSEEVAIEAEPLQELESPVQMAEVSNLVEEEPVQAEVPETLPEETTVDPAVIEAEGQVAEVVEEDKEPTHTYNGMDPEMQPRDIMRFSFAGLGVIPADYRVEGQDLLLTDAGLTLNPPKPGDEDLPRSGMLESPPVMLNFNSNAVNPMWKEHSPEGTEVLVEIALSPDGEHWTDWFPTTGAHTAGEISETYPDGRPNPNYGYVLGDMTFYGLKQYQFFKYALTLYSETGESPVVSDFQLFYQDSTMGEGSLVEVGEDSPLEVVSE